MTGRRRPRRAVRVIGVGLFAWFAAGTMAVAWRAAPLVSGRFGPGQGPPEVHLQPLTAPVGAAIALAIVGFLVATVRTRTGFAIATFGAAAYVALGGPAGAAVPVLAAVTLLLTVRLGVRHACPWLAAVPVALVLGGWREPALGLGDPRVVFALASTLVWTAVPALLALLLRGRREAAERAHAEELRRVAADERLRVARDIHDVVGHSLSMISLQSGVALRVLDADPGQARASLEAIRASSRDALAELRHTLGVFRADADLTPTPSLAGLPALVEDARAAGVRVDLTPVPAEGVPAAVQAVAFRVVQEALTNAVRHAPGAPVTLALAREPGLLRVTVADAGGPAEPPVEGGGLRGMRERVEALGGRLVLTPSAAGLTVTADLPWEES